MMRSRMKGTKVEPLPEGTYELYSGIHGTLFGGSEKMAPCNVANLDLLIKDKDGKGTPYVTALNSKASGD